MTTLARTPQKGLITTGKISIPGGEYSEEEALLLAQNIIRTVEQRDAARFVADCSRKPRLLEARP